MLASARLAHVADPCAIWYQFNQDTPLARPAPPQIREHCHRKKIAQSLRQKREEPRTRRNEHRVDDEDRQAQNEERNRRRPQRPRLSSAKRKEANENLDEHERDDSERTGEKMAAGSRRQIGMMRKDHDRSAEHPEEAD